MSLVTKFVLTSVKYEIDIVVKNLYFKLLANIINLYIFKELSLEKIDSNIKADVSILYFLIWEAADIGIVNTANYNSDISATTLFTANNKENLYFWNS